MYEILGDVAACDLPPVAECLDAPLRELGLDSARFVAFLAAVEERLGYVWTDDVPRAALATLRAVSQHVNQSSRSVVS